MLSKLKKLASFRQVDKGLLDISNLKTTFTEGLLRTMEQAFLEQQSSVVNTNYTQKDIDKIIATYSQKNMILAAASSIIPGPLGVLGAVPEVLLNLGNQMNMVYDLGCAYNKEHFINKDLLLDIPFAVFGGNTSLAVLQQKDNLIDSTTDILHAKALQLSNSIIDRTLKKSIVQYVPIGGAIVMGIWSKMTTAKMATFSKDFFDQSVNYTEHFKKEDTDEIVKAIQVQKIKALTNLIESNQKNNEQQIEYIAPIIANADIDDGQKETLLEGALKANLVFELDNQLLKDYEETENLITEMIILARRGDEIIDDYEKNYIYKVANDFGLSTSLVDAMIAI